LLSQADRAADAFRRLYGRAPAGVWSAPGRVNLIGEHTDYNDGFVLPFALPHRIAVAAAGRDDGLLVATTLHSDGGREHAEPVAVADLRPGSVSGWGAYPAGVAWVLREQGRFGSPPGTGAELVIAGDVPAGAGLSSSHALECATALALLGLAGQEMDGNDAHARQGIDRGQVARWVRIAENEFVGAPTGMLDQTASLRCASSHVLFLDVRSGSAEQVPFDAAAHSLEIRVIDTRVTHSNATSGYGQRRRGCEEAAGLLGVPALRDVSAEELARALDRLPARLRPLVRHVVRENDRVLRAVELLRAGRLTEVGPLLTASHESLRDDYQVSCPELDLAVDAALGAGALGARMTGGGFGGSAIALVPRARQEAVDQAVATAFAERSLRAPRLFTGVPSAGAARDL
jgi:galactokinase